MRLRQGGFSHTAWVIEHDLANGDTGVHQPQVAGLSDLVACVLACRSVHKSDWRSVLPRHTGEGASKGRDIRRFRGHALMDPLAVMHGCVPEVLEVAGGKTVALRRDQRQVRDRFACLMVSLRGGERAMPVAWRVVATPGPLGFAVQPSWRAAVVAMVPEGLSVRLAADRFSGTAARLGWCQTQGGPYRIRLKGDLLRHHEGGESTTGDAARAGLTALHAARLGRHPTTTPIGIRHEQGHQEPWIIAMSAPPPQGRVLDDGRRWGIALMCSDCKSRGFGLTQTRLRPADRLARLLLAMAMYWAVSTGMPSAPTPSRHTPKKTARCVTSWCKRGLRCLRSAALTLTTIPDLWQHANSARW